MKPSFRKSHPELLNGSAFELIGSLPALTSESEVILTLEHAEAEQLFAAMLTELNDLGNALPESLHPICSQGMPIWDDLALAASRLIFQGQHLRHLPPAAFFSSDYKDPVEIAQEDEAPWFSILQKIAPGVEDRTVLVMPADQFKGFAFKPHQLMLELADSFQSKLPQIIDFLALHAATLHASTGDHDPLFSFPVLDIDCTEDEELITISGECGAALGKSFDMPERILRVGSPINLLGSLHGDLTDMSLLSTDLSTSSQQQTFIKTMTYLQELSVGTSQQETVWGSPNSYSDMALVSDLEHLSAAEIKLLLERTTALCNHGAIIIVITPQSFTNELGACSSAIVSDFFRSVGPCFAKGNFEANCPLLSKNVTLKDVIAARSMPDYMSMLERYEDQLLAPRLWTIRAFRKELDFGVTLLS